MGYPEPDLDPDFLNDPAQFLAGFWIRIWVISILIRNPEKNPFPFSLYKTNFQSLINIWSIAWKKTIELVYLSHVHWFDLPL